jgi:hypothetical protein
VVHEMVHVVSPFLSLWCVCVTERL